MPPGTAPEKATTAPTAVSAFPEGAHQAERSTGSWSTHGRVGGGERIERRKPGRMVWKGVGKVCGGKVVGTVVGTRCGKSVGKVVLEVL